MRSPASPTASAPAPATGADFWSRPASSGSAVARAWATAIAAGAGAVAEGTGARSIRGISSTIQDPVASLSSRITPSSPCAARTNPNPGTSVASLTTPSRSSCDGHRDARIRASRRRRRILAWADATRKRSAMPSLPSGRPHDSDGLAMNLGDQARAARRFNAFPPAANPRPRAPGPPRQLVGYVSEHRLPDATGGRRNRPQAGVHYVHRWCFIMVRYGAMD